MLVDRHLVAVRRPLVLQNAPDVLVDLQALEVGLFAGTQEKFVIGKDQAKSQLLG